jgi:hypothetical protein
MQSQDLSLNGISQRVYTCVVVEDSLASRETGNPAGKLVTVEQCSFEPDSGERWFEESSNLGATILNLLSISYCILQDCVRVDPPVVF